MKKRLQEYSYWSNEIESIFKRFIQNLKLNKNLPIFLIFLFISTIFWLLKSLNKEYETRLQIPIRYINIPKAKILLNELPENLELEIRGEGFSVLRYVTTNPFFPITIDIEKQIAKQKRNNFTVLSSTWQKQITSQLNSGTHLLEIFPDTIAFHFSNLAEKKVPVKAALKLSLGAQRILCGAITVKPDSIMVHGSKSIIDTLQYISTNTLIFNNVSDSIKRNITIPEIKGITFSQKRVLLSIPVEPFTEKTLEISVTAINIPDSIFVRSFPGKVTVKCFVGLSQYNNVGEEDFTATIDYSKIKQTAHGQVQINAKSSAPYIKDLKIKPQLVDYLIEVKQ